MQVCELIQQLSYQDPEADAVIDVGGLLGEPVAVYTSSDDDEKRVIVEVAM